MENKKNELNHNSLRLRKKISNILHEIAFFVKVFASKVEHPTSNFRIENLFCIQNLNAFASCIYFLPDSLLLLTHL